MFGKTVFRGMDPTTLGRLDVASSPFNWHIGASASAGDSVRHSGVNSGYVAGSLCSLRKHPLSQAADCYGWSVVVLPFSEVLNETSVFDSNLLAQFESKLASDTRKLGPIVEHTEAVLMNCPFMPSGRAPVTVP